MNELGSVLPRRLQLSHHTLIDCSVLDLLGLERDPNLAPVVAASFQSQPSDGDLQRVEERLVLNNSAILPIPSRTSHPLEYDVAVMKRAHLGHLHIPVGERVKRLIQLQAIEEILAKVLHHSCVPNQIALQYCHRGEAFKEIWLDGIAQIVQIAKSLHELALLRRPEWSRRAVGGNLSYVFPHHIPVRQSASVFSS